MFIKAFQCDGGLGYQQHAILLRLNKSEHGYNYLCLDTHNVSSDNDMYSVGKIVEDMEDIYCQEIEYDCTKSELVNVLINIDYIQEAMLTATFR